MIYLDANATEPLRPEARSAAIAAMDCWGNPSSVHGEGRAARWVLEAARASIAARFGPGSVVFTSGGTEANALAIHGLAPGRRVLVGATEHPAVLAAASGAIVIPVDRQGLVDLAALETLLREGPALVCLMAANNETGVLHPIAEAAALCRAAGARLHVDAVQLAGRGAVPGGWDSLAISGHKLGGVKGAGALILAPGVEIGALIAGGGQERGRRGGTEPLPAIAAMAAAAACDPPVFAALRDGMEERLLALAPELVIAGADVSRLPNTSCLALPGVAAETQVIALDLDGVRVSAGAACSSGKVARSHVLEAMGFGALAGCAIRVSLPWNATAADVEGFVDAWAAMRARISRPTTRAPISALR
ncbi:cysteine desulfurase family protein [Plastoroseomonas arctica]|uniref:Cysteine desulfurase n=1 Tax=Plastoroseomonas arctica TaxID=1509237 RepID=A0AAF1JX81_9PROT|nr:aminotransferase class V-fold PLP-dependent enzyme [Plastoroseomonas arctica]MBR0655957.1 aminotransferase class V-fold PLP-dependent enzyme [Plastoroseomonas arctica]